MKDKPRIVHVLYRLDTGGMERTLVTLINHTHQRYQHAIVCLERFSEFRDQIEPTDVPCVALNKKPGKDWGCYLRIWRVLTRLRPDLVHTYNVGAVDVAPIARLAGIRHVIHAERGRDASDPRGESRKYRILRRGVSPFIDRYLAVSRDIQNWLVERVGIDPLRVVYIPNGIDVKKFNIAHGKRRRILLGSFAPPGTVLVGTVGRLDAVKDQKMLLSAFANLCESLSGGRQYLRLAIVGEGRQRSELEKQITHLGLGAQVCLLGNRSDISALLPEFDIFALSSLAEGMPMTLLEAMAAGLPVVATAVGGVGEVVSMGVTGTLVPAGNPRALAAALANYVLHEELRTLHGRAGRERVEMQFSLHSMLTAYIMLYDSLLNFTNGTHHANAASHVTGHWER